MDFKEDMSRDIMRMLAQGSQHDVKIVLDDVSRDPALWRKLTLQYEWIKSNTATPSPAETMSAGALASRSWSSLELQVVVKQ